MIPSLESAYPLSVVSESDLQNLCQVLWKWEPCQTCQRVQPCNLRNCAWKRYSMLNRFFEFYKWLTSLYVPELLPGSQPALRSHQDIIDIIRVLKDNPDEIRSELMSRYFSGRAGRRSRPPSLTDQHRAFNLAVNAMVMVSCSVSSQPSVLLELGTQPLPWHDNTTLKGFMTTAFPKTEMGSLSFTDKGGRIRDIKPALTARRLKRIARISFRGTDDLRNHLRLDARNGSVEIYHYTSVLKEHLETTHQDVQPIAAQVEYTGDLPKQVALEALHSIQMVLFPFDSNSEFILRSLVSKHAFDPDCLNYDHRFYLDNDGSDFSYRYFGARLMELYDEIEDPSPRGFMEKWLERKSGARYMMMATLVGVAIAIGLGILSLGVGIFQSWIAYKAWKYPEAPISMYSG